MLYTFYQTKRAFFLPETWLNCMVMIKTVGEFGEGRGGGVQLALRATEVWIIIMTFEICFRKQCTAPTWLYSRAFSRSTTRRSPGCSIWKCSLIRTQTSDSPDGLGGEQADYSVYSLVYRFPCLQISMSVDSPFLQISMSTDSYFHRFPCVQITIATYSHCYRFPLLQIIFSNGNL